MQVNEPPEERLWRLMRGVLTTKALSLVAELGVADAIGDGQHPVAEVAGQVGADADTLHRLLRALVGAGIGVALVPSLALTGRPDVRDLQITPQPTRYVGAYLPKRHRSNPAAERLLAAPHARAPAKETIQTGHRRSRQAG
jgi:DNA-binding transcriptional LysR family regulator